MFVAPRLRPGGPATLADFPDFADWPAVLAGLELAVERPDGTVEAPLSVAVSASSDALGRAVPRATTVVRAFDFEDLADRPLVSYPVTEVLGHLRNRWAELAFRPATTCRSPTGNASPIGGPRPSRAGTGRHTLADHFSRAARRSASAGIFEGVQDAAELSDRLRAGAGRRHGAGPRPARRAPPRGRSR